MQKEYWLMWLSSQWAGRGCVTLASDLDTGGVMISAGICLSVSSLFFSLLVVHTDPLFGGQRALGLSPVNIVPQGKGTFLFQFFLQESCDWLSLYWGGALAHSWTLTRRMDYDDWPILADLYWDGSFPSYSNLMNWSSKESCVPCSQFTR